MHILAALLIADKVRARIEEGDCPTTEQQPRELVEEALCELQKCIAAELVARHLVPMVAALRNADDYLSSNGKNYIGSGSQLHREIKAALAT